MELATLCSQPDVATALGFELAPDPGSGWWTAPTLVHIRGHPVELTTLAYLDDDGDGGALLVAGASPSALALSEEHATHPEFLAALNAANRGSRLTFVAQETDEATNALVCRAAVPAETAESADLIEILTLAIRGLAEELPVLQALGGGPVEELDGLYALEQAQLEGRYASVPAGGSSASTTTEPPVAVGASQSLRPAGQSARVFLIATILVLGAYVVSAWLSLSVWKLPSAGLGDPAHATRRVPSIIAAAANLPQKARWVAPVLMRPTPPLVGAYDPSAYDGPLWVVYARRPDGSLGNGFAVDARTHHLVRDYSRLENTGALPYLAYGRPNGKEWREAGLLLLACLSLVGVWSRRALTLRERCLTGGVMARAIATLERLAWGGAAVWVAWVLVVRVIAVPFGDPRRMLLTAIVVLGLGLPWLYAGSGLLLARERGTKGEHD
jgi:hypothetical protein